MLPSQMFLQLDDVRKTITAADCGGPGEGELAICNGGKTKMI